MAITEAELAQAFAFFDTKNAGVLDAAELRDRMGVFVPNLSLRECKLLVSADGPFTMDRLRDMLVDNELTNFDPIREAFKVPLIERGGGFVCVGLLVCLLVGVSPGGTHAVYAQGGWMERPFGVKGLSTPVLCVVLCDGSLVTRVVCLMLPRAIGRPLPTPACRPTTRTTRATSTWKF